MTNMYFFWKRLTAPPAPFNLLTPANEYLRFSTSGHWTQVGSLTHNHGNAMSAFGSGNAVMTRAAQDGQYWATVNRRTYIMTAHNNHPAPSSWSISANNNNPPGFGLGIVYIDLALWENSCRYFPEGAVIVSNGALVDPNVLSRYSAADGRFIVHAEPESLVGSSSPQSHTVSGTLGASNGGTGVGCENAWGYVGDAVLSHNHTVNLGTDAQYVVPRSLVTRLYEVLINSSRALANSVVFVDGSVGGDWEILTGWANANLKAGDSDPTLSGSDSHGQSFSGNSSVYNGPSSVWDSTPGQTVYDSHYHPVSGTLASTSHIPLSRQVIPARLVRTLLYRQPCSRCVMS